MRPPGVVRVWRALAAPSSVSEYLEHFTRDVSPALQATAGFRGAGVLSRDGEAGVELVVTTCWESLDSVRAFAGEDVHRAVVHPDARVLLLEFDERVAHYDLIHAGDRAAGADALLRTRPAGGSIPYSRHPTDRPS